MALRPKAFSIPSSTQLKVTFNTTLSENLSSSNFKVESLNGSVDDLEVLGVDLDGSIAIIKTRPQVAGNYYILKFLDTNEVPFSSDKGVRLVDDSVSRELFFVGIDNINPIRDNLFDRVPNLFSLENSTLKDVLSAQAEEIYTAQKKLGELLSDNYIKVDVIDEFRVRTSGATDRLANEQAYEVLRVSSRPTNNNPLAENILYTKNNLYSRLQSLPYYPISLQQVIVEDETINQSSQGSSFDGFLVTVASNNIIKLLSLKIIKSSDEIDCDGNLGTEYNIERYKYTLSDNYYDQDSAFKYTILKSNQFLISEFGNISKPEVGDTLIISYLTKDPGRALIDGTISVSRVESKVNESLPTNSNRFFLKNAPIVLADNSIPTKGGVTFKSGENNSTVPSEFKKELPYDISKLPSDPGEYTVNYLTGEVYLIGNSDRTGTARNNFVANYLYRMEFSENLDYFISNNDLVATPDRFLANQEAEIFINYENVYVKDIDYRFDSHIEVMGEQVENRVSQAFAIETKNSPITNVFRVFNQTTGEVYNPLYATATEVYFSGTRSPEIRTAESELANFQEVINEELNIVGELIIPAFEVRITSIASYNNITFSPGIPAEFISLNSVDYFIREVTNATESPQAEDTQIRFFGTPDGNNLITSLAISPTASLPTLGAKVNIGTRGYVIYLKENDILNQNLDSLGYYGNSSVIFNENSIFATEKFFEPIMGTAGFLSINSGIGVIPGFGKEEILYSNLKRLRNVGEYTIDYKNGIVYLAISANQNYNLGVVRYSSSKHQSFFTNILAGLSASKKGTPADLVTDAKIVYEKISNDVDTISINDLETSFVKFDNITEAADSNGELQLICQVLEDYTVVVPYYISAIKSINKYTDYVGANLDSLSQSSRSLEKTNSELLQFVTDGGANFAKNITFSNNIIDLKTTVTHKAYLQNNGTFTLTIKDANFESLYQATRSLNCEKVIYFDSKLNITKIPGVRTVNSALSVGQATISIITSELSTIDTSGDYLLDATGNRFLITSIDTILSTIIVDSPAENNILALEPVLDPNGTSSKIVVKPTITSVNDLTTITFPADSGLVTGEELEITYIPTFIPDIGTPLAIDYRFGDIYFDYNYVYDQIAVWYEYGDNTLDWSISNRLSEGDEYFVTYRYGAGRTGLKKNFGLLTQVPFFQQFPLEVDRELYRNGLKGTLQSFSKGPTIPAFKELVKSFTDIDPNIEESNFGSWILGRDYSDPRKVQSSGSLKFLDGKYESGLYFDKDTVVSIPALSNLSLREGTLEAWIRPDWAGINNDAALTFYLEGIGEEKYVLSPSADPFDIKNNWIMAPYEDVDGLVDANGIGTRFSNFKTINDQEVYGSYNIGIFKKFKYLSPATRIDFTNKLKVLNFGTHFNDISTQPPLSIKNNFSLSKILVTDNSRASGFSLDLSKISDTLLYVTSGDLTYTDLPDYKGYHQVKSCSCLITNEVDILKNFNILTINIAISGSLDISNFKSGITIVDDLPKTFVIVDQNNYIYQVVGFVSAGTTYLNSIPDNIDNIIIERFPLNNKSITQASVSDINNFVPTGFLNLYYKNVKIIGSGSNNFLAFNHQSEFLVNWSEYRDYRINRDSAANIVSYYISGQEFKSFYTDCEPLSNYAFSEVASGIWIGCFDNQILSNFELLNSFGTFYNRFNLSDIYIGKNSYNPKRIPFTVDRYNSENIAVGMPGNSDISEGIFIGFDDLCTSPVSSEIGQWVFRTRADRILTLPTGVIIDGPNSYTMVMEQVGLEHTFAGYILTDGEFASVVKSSRDEVTGNCSQGVVCDSSFRYCGNELLEEFGWKKLEESDSSIINTIVGGHETMAGLWRKEGLFETSNSQGIYRAGPSIFTGSSLDNILFTELPCSGGQNEYIVNLRVAYYDTGAIGSQLGRFSGATSGNLTGIIPIHIFDTEFDVKIALAVNDYNNGIIIVIDNSSGAFLDFIQYQWNDDQFHEFKLMTNYIGKEIVLYVDNLMLSSTMFSEYDAPTNTFESSAVALHIFDQELIDSNSYHSLYSGNIIDTDLIYFSGYYEEGDAYLESTDVFIHTDDRIDFEFNIDQSDGYVDAYLDSYDGYEITLMGVDEILMTSDKLRYLVDTGKGAANQRFSVFKDGKGFLNFRIFDNSLSRGAEASMYNIATSVKHFNAGEIHHVAVSWKFNSISEKDEMHLFIDGQEVPNLYRFGGSVPVRINEKYSDVSKEVLQSFLVRDIIYPEVYTNGTVSANNSIFQSSSVYFDSNYVGRSIIIYDAPVATTLIGQQFVIKSVTNGYAILGRGEDLAQIIFSVSDSNISFALAPYSTDLVTDVKNSRFYLFRTDASQTQTEMGGILYQVLNGEVDILSGQNVLKPKYRVNVDSGFIEFVGEDSNCQYFPSVSETDVEVAIKTFGLNTELCRDKIYLSGSSYTLENSKYSGQSVLNLHIKEPISLSDFNITRIILDKTLVEVSNPTVTSGGYLNDFEIILDPYISKVSSAEGRLYKQNLGRYLKIYIDSDNIDFCQFDGYQDAYQDGYLEGVNTITVYGKTIDGINEETFFVYKNGYIEGSKLFTQVDRVAGTLKIVDPNYYEVGVISIEERDQLSVGNNGGNELEVYQYLNGNLILSTVGSAGSFPFELHPGGYQIEFPTYLTVRLNQVGERIYIGSDYNSQNQFGGVIDEFRVISEMSSDTRITEVNTSGTRSVTNDYYMANPFCPDEQTLALIHFDNPLEFQARKLRTKEFLNEQDNYKYKLTTKQQESLLESTNDEETFISKMINYGFLYDEAFKTYIEVNRAEGGPIWNVADSYRNYLDYVIANNSVNSSFGNSAFFTPGSAILLENNSGLFDKREGTIEFWASPLIDTSVDEDIRYYIDISSGRRIRVKSKSSTVIELPNPATKIISVKLVTQRSIDSGLYTSAETDTILFDELARSQISGRLEGGTGVDKDFSIGHKLAADGSKIYLAESLPGQEIDVVVSYIPIDSTGDRISIFKNSNSQLVFSITANNIDSIITSQINWKKNSWHRVKCTYKTNSNGNDFIRMIIDGEDQDYIRYGTGLIHGTGYVYGQCTYEDIARKILEYRIPLKDDLRLIAIGADVFGDYSSVSRMDNLRFSRIIRNDIQEDLGVFADFNYSENLNTISPVVEDDGTTLILDFDPDGQKINNFITVVDPKNGIFNFKVDVIDNFNKVIGVNNGLIEDLIVKLVNTLKPAHSNAYVKFKKSIC